eukprot:IDg5133t1
MNSGSEATPWSDFEDEDALKNVQESQGVMPTHESDGVPPVVHDLPQYAPRPILSRDATFPAFRAVQPIPQSMPHVDMTQPSASDNLHQDGVAPYNVQQLVQAAVDPLEHRVTQIVTGEVNQRLAQYATRDEVTSLQHEIDRLSTLVSNLGK